MDDFERLVAGLDEIITSAFATAAEVRPRASGQYTERAADTERLPATIRGVYSAGGAAAKLRASAGHGTYRGHQQSIGEQPEFWISGADLAGLGWRPTRGDLLVLSGGRGRFAVSSVLASDCGGAALILTPEDAL